MAQTIVKTHSQPAFKVAHLAAGGMFFVFFMPFDHERQQYAEPIAIVSSRLPSVFFGA